MQALSLEQFEQSSVEFDQIVGATGDIDHFCSSSYWTLPASRALMPPRQPWLFRGAAGWVAMMRGVHQDGWRYLEPLEAMWGLACPMVGAGSAALAGEFVELCRERESEWDVLVLSGLPAGSQLMLQLARRLYSRYELMQARVPTTRHVASLAGGIDGYLSRRSRNFRKALRRALRASEHAGIEFVSCPSAGPDDAPALYERIRRIEVQSWKGRAGVGIDGGAMHEFYRDMVPRLAARGHLRVMFARHQDRDVAYVLGGVLGRGYRGLQFSFVADYEHLSLGNLCQYRQLIELCQEGVELYDLGTEMEYKRRWAELRRDSIALLARRR